MLNEHAIFDIFAPLLIHSVTKPHNKVNVELL